MDGQQVSVFCALFVLKAVCDVVAATDVFLLQSGHLSIADTLCLLSFRYFSTAMATAQNRQKFASNILAAYNQYNLDGIDFEYVFSSKHQRL